VNKYQPPSSAKPLDLRGTHLKIDRAKQHIGNLDAERVAFLGTNPYRGVPKFDAKSNRTEYILESLPEIPSSIPLILGDAIHSLRTALDYLACELVRSAGVDPGQVYFPISETDKKYASESGGKTKGMPQAAKDEIDKMRPYKGGNTGLWAIHKLDIIDKHRLLPTIAMRVGHWTMTLSAEPTEFALAVAPVLEAGQTIGFISGNAVTNKEMNVTADIAFGEPDVIKGRPVIDTLTQLHDLVKAIVSHFDT
jgi:hypothetical protein